MPEPILGCIVHLDVPTLGIVAAGGRRTAALGVDAVDFLDIIDVRTVQMEGRDGRADGEFQPRHGLRLTRSKGCRIHGSEGAGDFLGEHDAVVGGVGVEVEGCGGEVGEIVVADLVREGGEERVFVFGGRVFEGGAGEESGGTRRNGVVAGGVI